MANSCWNIITAARKPGRCDSSLNVSGRGDLVGDVGDADVKEWKSLLHHIPLYDLQMSSSELGADKATEDKQCS